MPQMIAGRAVQGMGREFFVNGIFGANFGMEFLYTFVIVVCSLMVYFGTRELYELSSHKGIKYFRLAFLFFAIAYFFRSGLKFVLVYFGKNIFDISPRLFGPLSAGIFMYFSSMAVFFLLYSVMWKKWKDKETWNYVFQTIAILFAVISMVSRGNIILLGINFILFLIVIFVVAVAYKDSKKKELNLYVVYLLLSLFWIFNIIDVMVVGFVGKFQVLIYTVSIGLFLAILYKVLRRTGAP